MKVTAIRAISRTALPFVVAAMLISFAPLALSLGCPAAAQAATGREFTALSQDTLKFDGLPHVALGEATLDTLNGNLLVENIGSSGADGVGVRAFKLTRFDADLGPVGALAAGVNAPRIEIVGYGALGGVPGSLLGSSAVTQTGGAQERAGYQLTADFSATGATSYVCEVFDGDTRVTRVAGLQNPIAILDAWPAATSFAMVKDYYPWPDEGAGGAGGLPAADWGMLTTGAVLIVEGRFGAQRDTTVVGNRVRILGEDPHVAGSYLSSLDLLAQDIPTITVKSESTGTWNARAIHEGSNEPEGKALSVAPNPTQAGRTVVSMRVPSGATPTDLSVFDVSGRRVRTLAAGAIPRGLVTLRWDGLDDAGRSVAPGIYFLRLSAGERSETQRVTLLR